MKTEKKNSHEGCFVFHKIICIYYALDGNKKKYEKSFGSRFRIKFASRLNITLN